MSTPGNSETYLVCKGFKGIEEDFKLALLNETGVDWPKSPNNSPRALLPEACLGEGFLQDISTAADYFGRLQASVIERNLRLFDHFSQEDGRAVHQARQLIVQEWIRRFRIGRIEVRLPLLLRPSLHSMHTPAI